jgi:hypothetical protein
VERLGKCVWLPDKRTGMPFVTHLVVVCCDSAFGLVGCLSGSATSHRQSRSLYRGQCANPCQHSPCTRLLSLCSGGLVPSTNTQTHRHTDNRHTDTHTHRHTHTQTHTDTQTHTYIQTDRQTDRQTDTHAHVCTRTPQRSVSTIRLSTLAMRVHIRVLHVPIAMCCSCFRREFSLRSLSTTKTERKISRR